MARSVRWVVDERSPRELRELLDKMRTPLSAVQQGRVFVGRVRAQSTHQRVQVGDVVEVFCSDAPPQGPQPTVVARRDGLLAVCKPAGLPTIPDQRGSRSLQLWVAEQLGVQLQGVHPTSRLDVGVSGLVVFALSAKARRVVEHAREQGAYQRHYVAIAARPPCPAAGVIDAPIGRAADPRLRQVKGRDSTHSQTRYKLVDQSPRAALIAVEPVTGRTHQIRVHMAHLGAPLLGDPAYGGSRDIVSSSGAVRTLDRVALHAAWVKLQVATGESWMPQAPIPEDLKQLWTALDGNPSAWDDCVVGIEPGS
jgi:23S rRNA pseudouridine1911/1915/1917 synthase